MAFCAIADVLKVGKEVNVCHIALVELVAVKTCPTIGADAKETSMVLAPERKAVAVIILLASVNVLFVNDCEFVSPTIVQEALGSLKFSFDLW